jgi:hypothetical protein
MGADKRQLLKWEDSLSMSFKSQVSCHRSRGFIFHCYHGIFANQQSVFSNGPRGRLHGPPIYEIAKLVPIGEPTTETFYKSRGDGHSRNGVQGHLQIRHLPDGINGSLRSHLGGQMLAAGALCVGSFAVMLGWFGCAKCMESAASEITHGRRCTCEPWPGLTVCQL